jgi:hypothetical protein
LEKAIAEYKYQAVMMGDVLEHTHKAALFPTISEALAKAVRDIDFLLSSLGRAGEKGAGALPPHVIDELLAVFVEDDASGITGPAAYVHMSICTTLRNLRPSPHRLVASDVLDHLRVELGASAPRSESCPFLPPLGESQPRPGSSVRAYRAIHDLNALGMMPNDSNQGPPKRVLTPNVQTDAGAAQAPAQPQPKAPQSNASLKATIQSQSAPKSNSPPEHPPLARLSPPQDASQPFAVKVEFPALPPWWDIYFMPRRAANGPLKKDLLESFQPTGVKHKFSGSQAAAEALESKTLPTGWKSKNSLAAASAKAMQRNVSEVMSASNLPPMPFKSSLASSDTSETGMGQIDLLLEQLRQETLSRNKSLTTSAVERQF